MEKTTEEKITIKELKTEIWDKAGQLIMWRGAFLILFGLIAIFWAGPTVWALVLTFGFFALIDGIILITMHIKHKKLWGNYSLWLGILSLAVGACAVFLPGLTSLLLAIFVAAWAFVGGILEVKMGLHLRKHIADEILLVLGGIISVLFGLILVALLIVSPVFGLLLLVEVLGIYAIVLGVILMMTSLKLYAHAKKNKQIANK